MGATASWAIRSGMNTANLTILRDFHCMPSLSIHNGFPNQKARTELSPDSRLFVCIEFLETFRGDSVFWPGGFRAAQVIALIVMAISFYWMRKWIDSDSTPDITVRQRA
jgi:hypothetical protein